MYRIEEAIQVLEVIEAVYASSRSGSAVKLGAQA
jgi:hypothetical protein